MNFRFSSRRLWATALASVPAVAILGTGVLERRILPAQMATHWSLENRVDESSPTWLLFGITLGIATVIAVLSGAFGLDERNPRSARAGMFIGGILSGGAAATWIFVTGVAVSTSGERAPEVGAWPLAFFGVLFGFVPMLATLRASTSPDKEARPSLRLEPRQVPAWIRNVDSGVLACVAGGLVATTALFMWLSDALVAPDAANLVVGGVMVVLALLTFSLSRLQLVIDRRGIRVRSRVSRMTLKFISVAEISEVRVESISPSNWGGWGYRILPSGSAIVLRTGEGIVVSRVNGKEFAVTAPNCAEGVALLAGLVESSRT